MTRIEVTDVFLRDGLQDEDVVVPTAEKLRVAGLLVDAGVPAIEAASFVHPGRMPQMADAEQVLDGLRATGIPDAARVSALALNARGVERAVAAGVPVVTIVTSASEAHSMANAGSTIDDALDGLASIVARHPHVRFHAGVSTAFTCPFEGDIDPARLAHVVDRFRAMGVEDVGLADTIGTTPTARVLAGVDEVRAAHPDTRLSLHLHDADGQALETALAAIDRGVVRFDAALAGFGGCPAAPGAHGNLATDALVRALHAAGHETGIDEHALRRATAAAIDAVATAPRLQPHA